MRGAFVLLARPEEDAVGVMKDRGRGVRLLPHLAGPDHLKMIMVSRCK